MLEQNIPFVATNATRSDQLTYPKFDVSNLTQRRVFKLPDTDDTLATTNGSPIGTTTPAAGYFTTLGSTELSNYILYVDGTRTDTYTADGSILLPYTTILAAMTFINASALAHQTANTYTQANYIINVAPGTYSDNFTIGNVKNLKFNMHGVYITGNITYTTTMVGGTADNYYSRLEFVGCEGNRAEKGTSARITGTFTATRNNDSLCYVSFKGVHIAGNMLYNTNGTWILSMKDCFFSAYLYTGSLAIVLLETTGHTEFGAYSGTGTGHISVPSTDAVVAVSLYNVDNTEFDLINISNAANSRITNCRFKSTSTVAAGNIVIDANSYKQLMAQTPTLSGATVVPLDGILPTATTLGFFTGGTEKWLINASNAFLPEVDNSYDIGNLASNPRDIHTTGTFIKKGSSSTQGYGYLSTKSIAVSKTLTNAQTNTLAIQIPSGAKLIGIQMRNDTAIAGVDDATGLVAITTYSAIYATGSTQTINASIAIAINTKVSKFFNVNAATDILSAATDVTLDAGVGNKFTAGGVISAIAYYQEFTDITSFA
jgi:hypothetical protein